MATFNIKRALLAGVGCAVLALPVAANHNLINLRGTFPSGHLTSDQAYIQSDCCVPTTTQHGYGYQPSNYSDYHANPTYVSNQVNSQGLRGFSNLGSVYHNPQAARDFYNQRSSAFNVAGLNIRTSPTHTEMMLDWQENLTGKAVTLLANRANGVLQPNSVYLGGGIKGGFMWQKTDSPGQFPLLSRFPFFSERTDTEAGVFAINNAALAFTSTFGDWTTIYMQPEYSETDFAGDQDEMQLRQAYVVFGNLEESPFYAAFGRKNIDFGNFDSYNAFTHNEANHYFLAVSDQPVLELGYYDHGFKIVGSAFSGNRQLRVAYADERNNIANYAFNAEKEFRFGRNNQQALTIGGGYLHDSIYRNNWTAHTFRQIDTGQPPINLIEYRNSIVSAFVEYNSNFLDAMVEYSTTLEPWAAAIPQDPDGFVDPSYLIDPAGSPNDLDNIDFDQNLEVLVAQARIKPLVKGRPLSIAATGSWGKIGDDFVGRSITGQETSWGENQQHAFSLEYPISPFLEVGAEYVYNKGFIPFVAPQMVSNIDTEAHAINVGFKARF